MKTIEMNRCPIREKVMNDEGLVEVDPKEYTVAPGTWTWQSKPYNCKNIDQDLSRTFAQTRFSLHNQDCDKLSTEHVNRFMASMEEGDVFPGQVLFNYNGKDLIASGNHTYAALKKLGYTHIKGTYHFSHPEPQEVAQLFNNRTSGVPESTSDQINRAVRRYNQHVLNEEENGRKPLSKKQWAIKYRISQNEFTNACRVAELSKTLGKDNVDVDRIKDKGSIIEIGKVFQQSKDAGLRIAHMTANFGLPHITVKTIRDGYTDNTKTAEEKEEFLKEEEARCVKEYSKVRKPNSVGRTSEAIFRDTLIELALRIKKCDSEKTKKLLNAKAKEALTTIKSFFEDIK